MGDDVTIDQLLKAESVFLGLSMPSHAYPSEDILCTDCCAKNCVLFLSRFDILSARFFYIRHYNSLGEAGKRKARISFLSTISRITDETVYFAPVSMNLQVCPTLLARIFGISTAVLYNSVGSNEVLELKSRPWYSNTIESLAKALHVLSSKVQFNSLNKIMLPPSFNKRTPLKESVGIPLSQVRKRMGLNLRERKADSLTRCNACSMIPELIKKTTNQAELKEAEKMLRIHHKVVSQQRVVIDFLGKVSRDSETDISVCLMDAMSNRCTKMPSLISRPKTVGDSNRIPVTLTSVQLCETFGSHQFRNIEFPVLQTIYLHDSNYNLSILLDGFSKFNEVASTIFVIMDSSRNNKSFVFIGGMGYILGKLKFVKRIVLVYPSVGHTHMSVDAHFGVVSKKMAKVDIKDPVEFTTFLSTIPSVSHVESVPTIYEFSPLAEKMFKPSGLCSNGIISLSKSKEGVITYASALTMNSAELLGAESDTVSKKLFKDEYYEEDFFPRIIKPNGSEISSKISLLFKDNSELFTPENQLNFSKSLLEYGTRSFRQLVSLVNSIPQKNPKGVIDDSEVMHMTVLSYMEKCGISVGRAPKVPTYQQSQLLDE